MITKEAKNAKTYSKNRIFFSAARKGFAFLLKEIIKKDSDYILMPSYIGETKTEGSGVFDPIRETKTNYEFYKIKEDLSFDFDNILEFIKNKKPKAILVIHYFGFAQKDIFKLAEICKQEGIYLIEDCAHTFESKYQNKLLGEIGDFALYSVHKLLPSKDGGFLQINNQNFRDLNTKENSMSKETLEIFLNTDISATSTKRIENYKLYLEKFNKNSKFVKIMQPKLEEGIVPLNFPIIIKNYPREKFYFGLIDRGVLPVSLYYNMISEIDKNKFSISSEISSAILNLPTHQDTEFQDIEFIIKTINNFEKELIEQGY